MKVKVCGVQTIDEARKLAELGVDFIGLNFVPASSRCISLAAGKEIAASLQGTSAETVALFQDQPLDVVRRYLQEIGPDYVQLHGRETSDYITRLDVPVIKAVAPGETPQDAAAYYLLDRPQRGQGPVIDTETAAGVVRKYPGRVFLAGGLSPENLMDILQHVQPFGIDIAGGVRTDNKIDFEKVKKVLEIVRSRT